MGFLCDRSHLTVADVDEVVREFSREGEVTGAAGSSDPAVHPATATAADLELDLSAMQLDAGLARSLTHQLDAIGVDQQMDQLRRLERSVMRLERVNLQTLGMLKKLVSAVTKPNDETSN
jgi:hypothetical protein